MSPEFKSQGNVAAKFMKQAQRSLSLLPEYAREALLTHEFALVAGHRVSDLHPGLSEHKSSIGFMAPTIKHIFLGEEGVSERTKKWLPTGNVRRVVFHETGHFIDLFVKGTGNYPDGYASDREDFTQALSRDVKRLQDTGFAAFHNLELSHAGFSMKRLKDTFIKKSHELYAELWAQIRVQSEKDTLNVHLPALFPDSFAVVKQHDKQMKTDYKLKKRSQAPALS